MSDLKRMDIAEFRDLGYLEEANRRFFHPLGLALAVVTPHPKAKPWSRAWARLVNIVLRRPSTRLDCVYDDRDDPEGWFFGYGDEFDREQARRRAAFVDGEIAKRMAARSDMLGGFWIQAPGQTVKEPPA